MELKRLEKELNTLREKVRKKLEKIGSSEGGRQLEMHKQNVTAFIKGRHSWSYEKVIEAARILGVK